ncbi:MAG: HEAT repeat domain-containing protein, partial [Candidatus Hodarchaeota archaeon]
MKNKKDIKGLIETLPSLRVFREAREALRQLIDDKTINLVIQTLRDEELDNKDKNIRSSLARFLGELGDKKAVKPLIHCLKDKNVMVRYETAEALGKLADKEAIEPLIHALNDEVDIVRRYVTKSLIKIGDERAIDPLIKSLKDKNVYVRRNAAEALGKIGTTKIIDPLIQIMKDRNEDNFLRRNSAEALQKNGWKPRSNEEKIVYFITKKSWDELKKLGKLAVELLILDLQCEDSNVRHEAAIALGNIGDNTAVSPLIQTINDEDSRVRQEVATALGNIGDNEAVGPLIQALKDEDNKVRREAAIALGNIGDNEAVCPLIQALKDEDWYVTENVAEALGKLEDIRAVDSLIQYLIDGDYQSLKTINALGKFIDEKAINTLIQAIFTSEYAWDIRDILINTSEWAIEPLIDALKSRRWYIREKLAFVLSGIKDSRAIEALIKILKKKNDTDRAKSYAAKGIESMPDPRAVEPLIKILEKFIKSESLPYEDPYVHPGFYDEWDMVEQELDACFKFDGEEDEYTLRTYSISALGKIGDKRAINVLVQYLNA